ncbi:PEGA domain-containing protein [Candidatus Entotheonella palauensis]|uniref:PEGA domain-containing protein n=1 Tax=Candidatus Entotheonella palauensis TaxID=93172 RepID=UPI000B7F3215|nr:PEGA domain-containing protein [Candidatus Entotheonella palauensis]
MAERNLDFSLLTPEQRDEILEVYRQTLAYSMSNFASGDTRPQIQRDIQEARRAIQELMRLQGTTQKTPGGAKTLRVFVESEPPGADVRVDGQLLGNRHTPCFIELTPDLHQVAVDLAEHRAVGSNERYCEVVEHNDRLQLNAGSESSNLTPQTTPSITFKFRRKNASLSIRTEPVIPAAEISIRGIEEHNRHIEIDKVTDDNGRLELPNRTALADDQPPAPPLVSGSYRVEGQWRPFFGIFAQFSLPKTKTIKLSGDASYEPCDVSYELSLPFFALARHCRLTAGLVAAPLTSI